VCRFRRAAGEAALVIGVQIVSGESALHPLLELCTLNSRVADEISRHLIGPVGPLYTFPFGALWDPHRPPFARTLI
jgi:hypothetical protein